MVVDYSLAGALAQFNRGGIVRDLAKRLTTQFAANLQAALAAATPPPAAPPARIGAILVRVVWQQSRRYVRQLFRRS